MAGPQVTLNEDGPALQPRLLCPFAAHNYHATIASPPPKAPHETAQLVKISPPLASVLLPALREMRLAFARVGEVRPRGSARRCEGFNPPSHAELSMRPSWTKKTDRLTHSSALAARGNDPHAGPQASQHILPRIRGLNVTESRGQQAPDLPALRRLPVPPMYPTKRRRRSRDREGICKFLLLRPAHFGPGKGSLISPSLY